MQRGKEQQNTTPVFMPCLEPGSVFQDSICISYLYVIKVHRPYLYQPIVFYDTIE